jgi:hypothetical protein
MFCILKTNGQLKKKLRNISYLQMPKILLNYFQITFKFEKNYFQIYIKKAN